VSGSACGIRSNGTIWCWGSNWHGQFGNNTSRTSRTGIPEQVLTDTGAAGWTDWIQIQTGDSQVCGLRAGGKAYCWGEGAGGQLGTTSLSMTLLPTAL
jgi:alpha-tubulin suppressor-like RCC1 family protein